MPRATTNGRPFGSALGNSAIRLGTRQLGTSVAVELGPPRVESSRLSVGLVQHPAQIRVTRDRCPLPA